MSPIHHTHAGKRRKIERIGYADAVQLIKQGYRLVGRELVSPAKPSKHTTRYQIDNDTGNCAEYHVTTKVAVRIVEEKV